MVRDSLSHIILYVWFQSHELLSKIFSFLNVKGRSSKLPNIAFRVKVET